MVTMDRAAPEFGPLPPSVATPLPTTVIWRWRYELGLLASTSWGGWTLIHNLGGGYAALLVGASVLITAAIRPTRRAVRRRLYWLATPHRIRLGMAQAWVHNRRGRLPTLLRTRMTGHGEEVLVWCPAGVSVEHLVAATDVLRSACWARDVRVTGNSRHSHLVTIEVVRRGGPRGS
ncbi:hypothetical protein [Cryptosporangium phraense]|uniref:Uncharacterized protein n=1 Tax=Cryptosporangium phraense TaxID=2593070 RepID=A0A545AFV5_9ACTN|nr:hypothetical protein [Cryptosporangium phraense]TQS40161.1 hypothetical protein FL583_36155 [Cryptosporangium phraense]